MAKKFIVVMIVFVILIFVQVQAMAFTTYHRSSLPILLPHPFKIDTVERLFSICIEEKVEKCKEIIETHTEKSAECVVESFKQCAEEAPRHDQLSFKAMEGVVCVPFRKIRLLCEIVFFNGMTVI